MINIYFLCNTYLLIENIVCNNGAYNFMVINYKQCISKQQLLDPKVGKLS